MRFDIITIFPDAFSYLSESILKRAQKKGLIEIKIHNLRDFAEDKHRKVDDKPYGGGPGMVLKIEPLIKAIQSITKNYKLKAKSLVILFTPAGKQFNNKMAADLAKKYDYLILICGHYEGIDARVEKVIENLKLSAQGGSASGGKIENLSVGSYTLTGGELPAMILIDAVCRRLAGVLGKEESLEEKRLGIGVPVYTRPELFTWKKRNYSVPKVLSSGNHLKISQWKIKHRKGLTSE